MSASASVRFTFDGTRDTFDRIYDGVCTSVRDVALDIGTHFEGTEGSIDFIVDDYARFEASVAAYSAKLGIYLTPANSLSYEPEA
jgi:hypothetical protein